MEPEQNTAPAAAESVNTPTPEAEVEKPLSHSAAAALLGDWTPEKPETTPPPEPAAEANAGTEEAAAPAEAEAEAEPAERAEPEAEPVYEFEKVHGNTKFRLRDGTEVTKAEIAKSWGQLQELPRRQAEFQQALQQAQQQIQHERARLASQEQLFQQVLPIAQQVMQQKMPQAPDAKLAQDDPIEHYQQMVAYQQEMGKFNQLRAAQQAQYAQAQQQAQQAQQQQVQQHLAQQRTKLVEFLPELRDDTKRAEFSKRFASYAKKVGFSEQEAAQVYDARLMVVVDHASKWQEHLAKQAAAKPIVAAKTANAVPVAAPARREASRDPASTAREQLVQKALKSGSRKDAEAALSHF